jgi:hypothetical protein
MKLPEEEKAWLEPEDTTFMTQADFGCVEWAKS